MAIALHYLILALRQDAAMESEIAREYCARAARWQAAACGTTAAPPCRHRRPGELKENSMIP